MSNDDMPIECKKEEGGEVRMLSVHGGIANSEVPAQVVDMPNRLRSVGQIADAEEWYEKLKEHTKGGNGQQVAVIDSLTVLRQSEKEDPNRTPEDIELTYPHSVKRLVVDTPATPPAPEGVAVNYTPHEFPEGVILRSLKPKED